jgi:teichuronic acid biosynthesis protein TuaE
LIRENLDKFKISLIDRKDQFILYALIISMICGTYMVGFDILNVHLYAFRIILILSLGIVFFTKNLILFDTKLKKYVFFFLVFWIFYGVLGLLWAPNISLAVHELVYITTGLFIYVTMIGISKRDRFESDLYDVWISVLLFVLLFSLYEIKTGEHLIGNFTIQLKNFYVDHDIHYTPLFTFDNPNNYAVYLSFTLVFLLFIKNKGFLNFFLILICCTFIYLVKSRLGELMVLFSFIFYFLFYFFFGKSKNTSVNKRSFIKRSIFSFLVFGIMALGLFHNETVNVNEELIEQNQSHQNKQQKTHLKANKEVERKDKIDSKDSKDGFDRSSVEIRKHLILNGLYFFKESNYLGVGPGGFQAKMERNENRYNTHGVTSPHNYFIEIISQYGIFITVSYYGILLYIVYLLIKDFYLRKAKKEHAFVLLLMISFLVMSNSNSSFLQLPINWFIFSLLIIWVDKLKLNKNFNV